MIRNRVTRYARASAWLLPDRLPARRSFQSTEVVPLLVSSSVPCRRKSSSASAGTPDWCDTAAAYRHREPWLWLDPLAAFGSEWSVDLSSAYDSCAGDRCRADRRMPPSKRPGFLSAPALR